MRPHNRSGCFEERKSPSPLLEIKTPSNSVNIPEDLIALPFNYHHVASSFVTDRHKVKLLQEYFCYDRA